MATMIESKGTSYVTAWVERIARANSCSELYVIRAIAAVTGSDLPESATGAAVVASAVGALTPDQGRAVVAEVQRQLAAIAAREATNCRYCGGPLTRGSCPECV